MGTAVFIGSNITVMLADKGVKKLIAVTVVELNTVAVGQITAVAQKGSGCWRTRYLIKSQWIGRVNHLSLVATRPKHSLAV